MPAEASAEKLWDREKSPEPFQPKVASPIDTAYPCGVSYRPRRTVPCAICGERAIARRLCRAHYAAAYARGEHAKFSKLLPEDVFDSRYERKPSGCWEWTGTRNTAGYGIFLLPGERAVRAHRYSYERVNGPIPEGMVLMHACDNPPCVNPAHLFPGSRGDNVRDAVAKRRLCYGTKHHGAKLTADQVLAIRASELSQTVLAKQYGVNPSTICRIKRGVARPHG